MLVDDAEDRMVIHPCEVSAIATPLDPSLWSLRVQCLPYWLRVPKVDDKFVCVSQFAWLRRDSGGA
jgi:hypothetical protein